MRSRVKRWGWFTGMIGVAAIAGLIILWQLWSPQGPILSTKEAEQVVLEQYSGEIEQITLEKDHYHLLLRSENGLYQVVLGASAGVIDSIRQVETAADTEQKALLSREQVKAQLQTNIQGKIDRLELEQQEGEQVYQAVIKRNDGVTKEIILDAYTGKTISSRTIPTSSQKDEDGKSARLLTEAEASKLALAEIPGEVDDVDLRDTDSGIPYYLVEIDLNDGREATVEVNAISGAIRSVTWDD